MLPPNRIEENRIEKKEIEVEENGKKEEIETESQETSTTATDMTINDIYKYYEKNITKLTDENKKQLKEYSICMNFEVIKIIINEAIEANAKTWNYISTILQDCYNTKIFTVEQFKLRQEKHKKEKSKGNSKQKATFYQQYDQRTYDNLDFLYANKNKPINREQTENRNE